MNFDDVRTIQRKERNVSALVELNEEYYKDLAAFAVSKEDPRTLENVLKLARDVFDKREQKLLMKALRNVRTGDFDYNHMTPEEKAFFDEVAALLKKHRKFFDKVLIGEYEVPEQSNTVINNDNHKEVLVHVKKTIPRFVGEEGEYGPFQAGDMVRLPKKEADLLSEQDLAEII